MGGSKNAKEPNGKKGFLNYISKDHSLKGEYSKKMKGLKKLSIVYKMKTLDHIIIYNVVFSLVSSSQLCNPCCMTSTI
jgi:hypothetical protein